MDTTNPEKRPKLTLWIQGKHFLGLLDTGADVSVIAHRHWPTSWPTTHTTTELQGIGQAQGPLQSLEILNWTDPDRQQGTFCPYVLPGLSVNLWGRDVLSQMHVTLYSPSTQVSHMMFNQGFLPSQGLGKSHQGITAAIQVKPKNDKLGLGYPNLT